jgi:hypothetical protein
MVLANELRLQVDWYYSHQISRYGSDNETFHINPSSSRTDRQVPFLVDIRGKSCRKIQENHQKFSRSKGSGVSDFLRKSGDKVYVLGLVMSII